MHEGEVSITAQNDTLHCTRPSRPVPVAERSRCRVTIAHHDDPAAAADYPSDISGLIRAFRFAGGGAAAAIAPPALADLLARAAEAGASDGGADDGAFPWLHRNLSQAGCARWLQAHLDLPDTFIGMLGADAHSTRIEQQEGTLVAVFTSFVAWLALRRRRMG